MVRDAYLFLTPLAVLVAILFFAGFKVFAFFFLLIAGFVAFFFRDPERTIPADPLAIVSPADGKIVRVYSDEKGSVLSIFLSISDVHVNRAPIEGKILRKEYKRGRFVIAFDERASAENEQMIMTIRGTREITFSLIAGIIARRIVVWKNPGDHVNKGDKIGLIRFGSRVDVFLPPDCDLAVKGGDRVQGGSSVIAKWRFERETENKN